MVLNVRFPLCTMVISSSASITFTPKYLYLPTVSLCSMILQTLQCSRNRNWDSPDLMQFWFLFFSFLFLFFFFCFVLFCFVFTAVIILAWTPKICLECLLCCNQSQVRSSHYRNHRQRTVSDRSWNKLFSFCLRIQTALLGI